MEKRLFGKRFQKAAAAVFLLLLLGIGVGFGQTAREDSLFSTVLRQGKTNLYLSMIKTYAPSVFYEQSNEKSAWEVAAETVQKVLPVYGYVMAMEEYETKSESDISYEKILAQEAMDENYVDENGDVVGAKEDASSPDEDVQEQEEQLPEEVAQAPAQEPASPAGSFVPSQTPVADYPMDKLNDFDYLIHNFYVVDKTTTITSSQLNGQALLEKSMKLTGGADAPQILIYHTHSQERYADSAENDPNTSVVGVGERLAELLRNQYGFHVIHHTGEYDVASRDDAYSRAGPALEQLLADNPSIEIVIDLHRDGVPEGTHLVTEAGGKQMASIMFFNGLSRTTANGDISYLANPYIADNLAFSFQMQLTAAQYYPGFSRAVYLKGYRYNMHYCPRTLLVEVGAQTNTVEEAMNAMDPLADILAKVITPAG